MDLFWGAGKSTSLRASHPQPAQTSNTSSHLLETREKPSPGEAWSCFLLHWVFWDPSVSSMGFPNEWLCGSVEGPGSPILLSSSHSISSAQAVGSGTHGPWRVTQLPALSLACPGTRDSPLLCRAATAPLGKEVSRRLGLFVSWGL